MNKKICFKCKVEKEISNFPPRKGKKFDVSCYCRKCISSLFYERKKDLIKTKNKIYYEDNKEKALKQRKLYRDTHKKERNVYLKKRRKEIDFRIIHTLRNRVRSALKNNQKKGSAIRDLGCTIPELKVYLEKQFKYGMTWENYGFYGWHIDHIKPLSKFDLTSREQFLEANHYTNLQPLWAADNIRKKDKYVRNS